MAASRRPGLQSRWQHVYDSLESIIPIYEEGSSRIAMFSDSEMREEVVDFAVRRGELVLDLGSGPGTLARVVTWSGGTPVLLDASRKMLMVAGRDMAVQAVFEALPFRDAAFGSVVAGFWNQGLARPPDRRRGDKEDHLGGREVRILRPRKARLFRERSTPRFLSQGWGPDNRCCDGRKEGVQVRVPL